jgi:hypothetical protein
MASFSNSWCLVYVNFCILIWSVYTLQASSGHRALSMMRMKEATGASCFLLDAVQKQLADHALCGFKVHCKGI